jgi:tyrosyl-tRNA synthetase
MSDLHSDFLRVLTERGYIHQGTDQAGLDAALNAGPVTTYVGYDCTAPSLHVGSLVSIMMLRWLQKFGGKPIVLLGGGTTRIGDPSGKDESRKLLTDADIDANLKSLGTVFERFVPGSQRVNNADWLGGLHYVDFLREVGRHFSVNRMLTFDSVKLRLDREQPLSFLEFNYMVLQAYDFVELYKRFGCTLQMGGADQWGNIVNGIDLGRRMAEAQLFGLTCPLITTASGAKMGKTAQGAIWLNAEQRSPYEYWQFWRNTEDADVERFLKLFTELPMNEVRRLASLQGKEVNEAKKVLAHEATTLCHGEAAALAAANEAQALFSGASAGAGSESVALPRAKLEAGLSLVEALRLAQLAESNGKAHELIKAGGARINDVPVKDPKHLLTMADIVDGGIKLSSGKKNHKVLRPE